MVSSFTLSKKIESITGIESFMASCGYLFKSLESFCSPVGLKIEQELKTAT
jgi:hypothetical protein